jgi:ribosomal protein L40E
MSPVSWLQYGRALIEGGHVEGGLAALEKAQQLSDADSRTMIEEMSEHAREELLIVCSRCSGQNPADAQVCRRCLGSLSDDPVVRALAFLSRPALRFLLRSPGT